MAYIAFASAKGSPGVTTAVTALAAAWPAERDLLVAEVDPSGGDLVVRLDLATEPGLVSLAAAGRRELGADRLIEHTQVLTAPGGADGGAVRRVLVAPVSAEQATVSLSALRGGLGRVLDDLDLDVLVDCGRLDPSSAAFDLATNAALLVMVARPVVAEVHHLSSRLASAKPRAVSLLMVGDKPYSVSEVGTTVGASPLGTLPVDVRAAAVLSEGHPNAGRLLRRSTLLRDARALAEGLCEWIGPQAASVPPGSSPASLPRPDTVPSGPASPVSSPPPPPPSAPRPRSSPPPSPSSPPPSPAASPPAAPTSPSLSSAGAASAAPAARQRPPSAARSTPPPAPVPSAPQPPPARFSPTLPADDAVRTPARPSPLPPPVPPASDGWTSPAATTTFAAPEPVDQVEPVASGDTWAAASPGPEEGRAARLNGRRRLGGAPKHFRRDPEDQSR